jgi:predicted permease
MHQEEMQSWFREHSERTAEEGGLRAWVGFWYVILNDFVRTIVVQHREGIGRLVDRAPRHNGGGFMEALLVDARIALRSFARRPSFLVLSVATLGLGVGSATTVYSVVHGVLLAPLPYPEPERIVRVGKISDGRAGILSMSALDIHDLQERNRSFEALAASRPTSMTVVGDGEPELMRVAMVSSEFFQVMGIAPAIGRVWTGLADEPGGEAVIVIGHDVWQRRWGGNPELLGKGITLNGTSFTVIGIMPADFIPPEALSQRGIDAWIPLAFVDAASRSQRGNGFLQVIGRVRSGVTLQTAEAELRALGAAISRDFPGPGERVFGSSPLRAETIGGIAGSILPLLGAVGLLLAIACVNVANLLLVRASERGHEMLLRQALGASRLRLVRQLMTECLLLGMIGGLIGAVIAIVGVQAFAAFGPRDIPRLAELVVNDRVLWTALAISLLTSLGFGLLPALRGSHTRERESLVRGSSGGGRPVSEVRIREMLVVAETSLAVVLVVAGGLLFNSFLRLGKVDLGFAAQDVEVVAVAYPGSAATDEVTGFYEEVMARVARVPGVSAVGATAHLPLSGNTQMRRIRVPGMALSADDREHGGYPVNYQQVTPDYFRAMSIPIRRGRSFESTDNAMAPPVAIVNEALAGALVGDGNAVGRRFTFSDDSSGTVPYEIVGVVADIRQQRMEAPGEPELYLSFYQNPAARMEIVARSSGSDAGVLSAMREQVWAVRPSLPVRRSVELSDFVAGSIADRRFHMLVLGGFASLALALALVGVYGTIAYSVSQRRRELGVRMALGATASSILTMVLGRSMRAVSAGVAIGLVVALLTTRVLESMLFGITPTDPLTLAIVVTAVLTAAGAASVVPARRAARLDPMVSLRQE